MKKNVLNNIEKIIEKRNLSEKVEKKIRDRAIANWAMCISMDILIMTFVITANFLSKASALLVYNVYSFEILLCALILLEVAYKKDSGIWAISGLEVLVLAIFTLFSPYFFFGLNHRFIYILLAIVSVYYSVKIIKIYYSEKKKYLLEISDIPEIIKKESQDELAKKEQEKIMKKIKQENKTKTTKKKTTTKTSKPKTKTTKKTTTAKSKTATKPKTTKKTATKKTANKEKK